jgi:hypothetical protein
MKIWCQDFRDRIYTDAIMRDATRFRGIAFMFGRSLTDRFPTDATIEIRSERAPTDFFMAGPFPVVSSRLKGILEEFAVQGEFMPVRLVRRKGDPVIGNWYCFNAVQVCACFDRTRSRFEAEQDYATNIERLAINDSACKSAPLVLAEKTIPHLLVVRDDLANAITSAGCSGVFFETPDVWRNPVNPLV